MAAGTVLVVDDAPGIVYILQIALQHAGYRVISAVAGNALQLARDVQPDVILLDVMMPGVDGVEIGRDLRAEPRTARIPVIAISAQADVTLRLNVQQMGADDYLSKPFEFDDMLRRVGAWAARSHELGRAITS